ncbi:MAG: putative quinol monooxygenase [Myxococcales bacterium]|nr:putative quinol monooxygenase [Myxococcales bacterium]
MIVVIARMKVAEGKAEAFKQTMGELAGQVRQNEPGCKMYQLCAGKDPHEFTVVERYVDKDALGTHSQSPHMKEAMSKLGTLLAGRPELQILREVE